MEGNEKKNTKKRWQDESQGGNGSGEKEWREEEKKSKMGGRKRIREEKKEQRKESWALLNYNSEEIKGKSSGLMAHQLLQVDQIPEDTH